MFSVSFFFINTSIFSVFLSLQSRQTLLTSVEFFRMASIWTVFIFCFQLIVFLQSSLFYYKTNASVSINPTYPPLLMKCYPVLRDKIADCSNRGFLSVPKNLPLDTRVLDLSHNDIQILEHNSFSRYRNLIKLSLKENDISEIEKESFFPLGQLLYLDLSSNMFTNLPGGDIFKSLRSLLYLSLSNNRATSTPSDILTWLPKLKLLSLDHNELSRIHITACSKNTNLTIDLRHNRFEGITSETFIYPCESDFITVEFNPIRIIEADAIASTPVRSLIIPISTAQYPNQWKQLFNGTSRSSLQALLVTDSNIDHFPFETFVTMGNKSLTTLKCKLRNLHYLSQMIFANLSSVSELYLEFGKLSMIEPEHFYGMSNLRTLSLKRNDISSIRANFTSKWEIDLHKLDFSFNALTAIYVDTFCCMENLTSLDLSYNTELGIVVIYESSCLGNLQYLNLSGTLVIGARIELPLLTSFHSANGFFPLMFYRISDLFKKAQLLEEIYMSNTVLPEMFFPDNTSMFSGLTYLRYLTLSKTILYVIPRQTFVDQSSLRELDVSFCSVPAIQPGTFDGLKSLRILHLQGNKLQHLSGDTFGVMQQLEHLHVDSNILTQLDDNLFVGTPFLSILTLSNNKLLGLNQSTLRPIQSPLIGIDMSKQSFAM